MIGKHNEIYTSFSHSLVERLAFWCHTLWTESVMATAHTRDITSSSLWIIWE